MAWKRARAKAGRLELLLDSIKAWEGCNIPSALGYIRLWFGSWSVICTHYCLMFFYFLHIRYPEHTYSFTISEQRAGCWLWTYTFGE